MLLVFIVYKIIGNIKGKACVIASCHVVVLPQPCLLLLAKYLLEEERWENNGFLRSCEVCRQLSE